MQPALLDRLTDDDPTNISESPDMRFMSKTRMRDAILRDLGWLFNTTLLSTDQSLEEFPEEIAKITGSEDSHLKLTPKNSDSGLAKLVLTLVELIRKLVEKQAMRRVDGGSLTDEEIERLGETLMNLELKMEELKKHFNLTDHDLNINLGPLGDLM